jgi:hypothetical protein
MPRSANAGSDKCVCFIGFYGTLQHQFGVGGSISPRQRFSAGLNLLLYDLSRHLRNVREAELCQFDQGRRLPRSRTTGDDEKVGVVRL